MMCVNALCDVNLKIEVWKTTMIINLSNKKSANG